MEDEEAASKVEPSQMELRVQVLDLPPRLQSEQVLREVGDYVGTFVTADEKNLDGNWKDVMRIRVALDIYKPVKRRMKIKKAGGDWRYRLDPSHVVSMEIIELRPDLTYEEEPIEILTREVKELWNKKILLVKVLWRNHKTEEATWESEEMMRQQYP